MLYFLFILFERCWDGSKCPWRHPDLCCSLSFSWSLSGWFNIDSMCTCTKPCHLSCLHYFLWHVDENLSLGSMIYLNMMERVPISFVACLVGLCIVIITSILMRSYVATIIPLWKEVREVTTEKSRHYIKATFGLVCRFFGCNSEMGWKTHFYSWNLTL